MKVLFRCSRIHINPYVLGWIGVKLELNYTPNPPQHIWIEVNLLAFKQGRRCKKAHKIVDNLLYYKQ